MLCHMELGSRAPDLKLVMIRFGFNNNIDCTGILVLSEHFWDIICSVWIIYE